MDDAVATTWYRASVGDVPLRTALAGDVRADVAIVGGGFTGVATALELAEGGVDVVLLEARRIGDGATGRNGGQVTGSLSGLGSMRRQLVRTIGAEAAADFVRRLRWDAQALSGPPPAPALPIDAPRRSSRRSRLEPARRWPGRRSAPAPSRR